MPTLRCVDELASDEEAGFNLQPGSGWSSCAQCG